MSDTAFAAILRAFGTGALCALPLAVLFALRYLRLRGGMDEAARRSYLLRAIAFGAAGAVAASLLADADGAFALPAIPAAALGVAALVLVWGSFKRD